MEDLLLSLPNLRSDVFHGVRRAVTPAASSICCLLKPQEFRRREDRLVKATILEGQHLKSTMPTSPLIVPETPCRRPKLPQTTWVDILWWSYVAMCIRSGGLLRFCLAKETSLLEQQIGASYFSCAGCSAYTSASSGFSKTATSDTLYPFALSAVTGRGAPTSTYLSPCKSRNR